MVMSDALLFAYLAGAIDSDGCISVKRSTYSMRVVGDSKAATFSERVKLKQVTPDVPELLREAFGGSLRVDKPSVKSGRPLYSWQATDLRAANCLRALLPFLRVKRAQALNCLALRDLKEKSKKARVAPGRGHVGSAPRPAAITTSMEQHFAESKMLNRVGLRAA
jgi:hypothetical protein